MDQKDREMVQKAIRWYYKHHKLDVPAISRREFGYGVDSKIDKRHLCFETEEYLNHFLQTTAPLYVSYSTAFYKNPGARPMEAKEWLGAELVFDLDIDVGQFFDMAKFEVVRENTLTLIHDFLIQDFGIKKEDIAVNFSGHKGFHVHVHDQRFFELLGEHRRELVDYITGVHLAFDQMFYEDVIQGMGVLMGPKPVGTGYQSRFAHKVCEMVEKARTGLLKDPNFKRVVLDNIKKGVWDLRKRSKAFDSLVRKAFADISLSAVNVDAAVTYDTKRLIRVPNSLYGGTGFVAKVIRLNELEKFDPRHDATPFPEIRTTVVALRDVPPMEFHNTTQERLVKGKSVKLDLAYALFLVGKGVARFGGG